jgi:DNA-binding transcriptional regulator YiaG
MEIRSSFGAATGEEAPIMRSTLGQAIRKARRTCGFTQVQLAARLDVKGRAVYRWERGTSVPSKSHQSRLLLEISSRDQQAAEQLRPVLLSHWDAKGRPTPPPAPPAPAAPPPVDPRVILERSVFVMADELDLPANRVRGSFRRLLRRLRESYTTLDAVQGDMEEWLSVVQ